MTAQPNLDLNGSAPPPPTTRRPERQGGMIMANMPRGWLPEAGHMRLVRETNHPEDQNRHFDIWEREDGKGFVVTEIFEDGTCFNTPIVGTIGSCMVHVGWLTNGRLAA